MPLGAGGLLGAGGFARDPGPLSVPVSTMPFGRMTAPMALSHPA
ncbi:hypothetical protein [Streptomyces sp. NBC_01602]